MQSSMRKLFHHLLWFLPFFAFAVGYFALSFIFKSKTINTPALMGKSIDKAITILSDQNLNMRIVGTKPDADLPEGTIISQTPAAGSKIKENQTMYVVIAKKPAAIIAPDLKNKTISCAQKIAQDLGITIKHHSIPSEAPKDHCIAQVPSVGNELENNTMMVYVSSEENKPVIMPSFKNVPVDQVLSFLQLHGITPTIIHSRPELLGPNHQCTQCIVIDQRPMAGSLIQINTDKMPSIQLQAQER